MQHAVTTCLLSCRVFRSIAEVRRQRKNGCTQLWRNLRYDKCMDVGRLIALFLKVGGGSPAVTGDIWHTSVHFAIRM